MQRYKWNSDYELRVPKLDAEHQAIFRVAADLRSTDNAKVQAALKRLSAHVTKHFSGEEKLMLETRYGSLEWHKRQHEAGRKKARQLASLIRAGHRHAALLCLDEIFDWLDGHIRIADRMLAAHLQRYERTRIVPRRVVPQCVIA